MHGLFQHRRWVVYSLLHCRYSQYDIRFIYCIIRLLSTVWNSNWHAWTTFLYLHLCRTRAHPLSRTCRARGRIPRSCPRVHIGMCTQPDVDVYFFVLQLCSVGLMLQGKLEWQTACSAHRLQNAITNGLSASGRMLENILAKGRKWWWATVNTALSKRKSSTSNRKRWACKWKNCPVGL